MHHPGRCGGRPVNTRKGGGEADEAQAREKEPPAQILGSSHLEAENHLALVAINWA
jgi:hypothetical protein